jgi:hypothetical protein
MVGVSLGCAVGTMDMEGFVLGFSDGRMLILGCVLGAAEGAIDKDGSEVGWRLGLELVEGESLGEELGDNDCVGNTLGIVEGSLLTLGLSLGARVGASVGCDVGWKMQSDGVVTVWLVLQEASFPALSVAVTVTSKTVTTLDTVLAPAGGY